MDHNLVNEELMNEQNHGEEHNTTSHEENSKTEVVQEITEEVVSEQNANETVEEVSVEPHTESRSLTEPQTENEVVKGDVSTEAFTERAALEQVKALLLGGNAPEYIPQATASELVLFMDQLGHSLNAENFAHFLELGKLIKEAFDNRVKADAVGQEQAERFSAAYGNFNKRKVEHQKHIEESNTSRKKELIQKLKDLMESGSINHNIVKEIQAEWKTLRFISKEIKEQLDNTYRNLLDNYYKRKGQEMELMDYDRKRNLEIKTAIIEKIRVLLPNEEESHQFEVWRERASILAELQKEWREAGHVPREEMERVNMEYKDVVDNFFAQRREFVESQEQGMQENADKKELILEKMNYYIGFASDKPKDWEEATKALIVLQEEWKTVGKAPNEKNAELWKRFREVGNNFFANKSAFFKNLESERVKNLEAKTAIVEKAESLKDGNEWDKIGKIFRELHEEWKQIGSVPDRFSNKIWNRFREATDVFYERRREFFKDIKQEEDTNLEQKRSLINRVKEIITNLEDREMAFQEVREIQAKWREIGRVPIKLKEVIWEEFTKELDAFFEMLRGMKRENGNNNNNAFSGNNNDKNKRSSSHKDRPRNERSFGNSSNNNQNENDEVHAKIQRLRKKIAKANETIDQYSTNILFIAKGKSGDALRKQIQDEIDREAALVLEYKKQIKELETLVKKAKEAKDEAEKAEIEKSIDNVPVEEVTEAETNREEDAPIAPESES